MRREVASRSPNFTEVKTTGGGTFGGATADEWKCDNPRLVPIQTPLGLGEKSVGVAIVPNQAVGAPVMTPVPLVEYIRSMIGAHPQAAAGVEAQEQGFIGA